MRNAIKTCAAGLFAVALTGCGVTDEFLAQRAVANICAQMKTELNDVADCRAFNHEKILRVYIPNDFIADDDLGGLAELIVGGLIKAMCPTISKMLRNEINSDNELTSLQKTAAIAMFKTGWRVQFTVDAEFKSSFAECQLN